jgi:large conductance mechanosensitive channel
MRYHLGRPAHAAGGRMLKEFREFALRGNVIDLAVGVIVGAAFGKIVASLVNDVIMPPLGLLIGRVDFSDLFIDLSGGDYPSLAAAKEAGAATLNYGLFINTVIQFVIVAFAIFVLVRQVNRVKRFYEGEAVAPAPSQKSCSFCFTNIPIKATRCPNCTSQLQPS